MGYPDRKFKPYLKETTSPSNGVLRPGAELLYYNTIPDPSQRVFGAPGASLHHTGLNQEAVNAGIAGEERTAATLERLASNYPNTYVFHSVKLPGRVGDMDHIVVQGTRALLVDSKNWRTNATYELADIRENEDLVLRDGEPFPGGEIHLRRQLVDWQLLFMNSDVYMNAVLVLAHNNTPVVQHVETGYDFTNLNGLSDVFAATFNLVHAEPLSDDMLEFYAGMVQNPDFDPNDISFYTVPEFVVKPKMTTSAKWLVVWSFLNYVLMPLVLPVAALSTIPLIFLAHRAKKKAAVDGSGGQGMLTATLVFSYLLLAVWMLGLMLVIMYNIMGSSGINLIR
jgi:hypothetical protein